MEVISLRTEKRILKKVESWKGNPMLVAGLYRLFTYIPWESIPEEYIEFFEEDAKNTWNDDLDKFKKEHINLDMQAEIHAILQTIAKRNITHALGLVPIILADAYVYGAGIATFQGRLVRIINEYKVNMDYDRDLAEQEAIFATVELLKDLASKTKLKLEYDIDEITQTIMERYSKAIAKQKEMKQRDAILSTAAEAALAKEREVSEDDTTTEKEVQGSKPS